MKYLWILFSSLLPFSCYAQSPSAAPPLPYSDSMQTMVMLAIAFVFFYFIIVRPEQKKRKEMDARRDSVSKGDKVIIMGIIGTVKDIKKDTLMVKMADGQSVIEVFKNSVTDVITKEA